MNGQLNNSACGIESGRKRKSSIEADMQDSESMEDDLDNLAMLAISREFFEQIVVAWLDQHGSELLLKCFDEVRKPSKPKESRNINKK